MLHIITVVSQFLFLLLFILKKNPRVISLLVSSTEEETLNYSLWSLFRGDTWRETKKDGYFISLAAMWWQLISEFWSALMS